VHWGEDAPGPLGAGLLLRGEAAGGGTNTDEAGAFALQVEEGATRLRVDHPRFQSASVEVAAGASQVEVALSPGRRCAAACRTGRAGPSAR
jgi:hypothetical protein